MFWIFLKNYSPLTRFNFSISESHSSLTSSFSSGSAQSVTSYSLRSVRYIPFSVRSKLSALHHPANETVWNCSFWSLLLLLRDFPFYPIWRWILYLWMLFYLQTKSLSLMGCLLWTRRHYRSRLSTCILNEFFLFP